jgi:imidazolonepropionase-like amidohydrolase
MGDMIRLNNQVVTLRSTYILKGMLRRGFTTVRDTGGATKFIANALAEGLIEGPRLYQCGKALSQTGGHGDLLPGQSGGDGTGCCGGSHAAYGRTADGVPACLKAVREELKQGADFIKIMLGGGVSSETDAIDTVQYTSEEVKAITTTASQMGKKMVSVTYPLTVTPS